MINFSFQDLKRLIIFQMIIFFILHQAIGQNTKKQFKYVVGHSTFIFLGTITHMDSSNVNANIYGKKAIVRVEEIVDGSAFDSKLKGEEITVIFSKNLNHKKGDKQIFYTIGWSYGKAVAVIDVKNTLSVKFTPNLQQQIEQVRIEIVDDSLKVELKRSVLVARCIVKSIDDSIYNSIFKRSEHNPGFRKVTLEIKEVLKGKTKKDSLSAYYASSYDPIPINSPKLSENMEAVFLFNKAELPSFLNIPGYTLLDPRDVQPVNQLGRIKKLLKNLY